MEKRLPARQMAVFDVNEKVYGINQAQERLAQIRELLSPGNKDLSVLMGKELEQIQTGLQIERTWWEFKLGNITPEEKQKQLVNIFDKVEQNPDLFEWLFSRNERNKSMAELIRDKVIPPNLAPR